jgi:hypothetical protein
MDDVKKRREKLEDKRDEPSGDGGNGSAADVPPAVPSDDDSALGDTDQHSTRRREREPGRGQRAAQTAARRWLPI